MKCRGSMIAYTLRSLAGALSGAGLHIEELRYINPINLFEYEKIDASIGIWA